VTIFDWFPIRELACHKSGRLKPASTTVTVRPAIDIEESKADISFPSSRESFVFRTDRTGTNWGRDLDSIGVASSSLDICERVSDESMMSDGSTDDY
jgi:hypothetical protein